VTAVMLKSGWSLMSSVMMALPTFPPACLLLAFSTTPGSALLSGITYSEYGDIFQLHDGK
jgi:hypothetical protein